MLDDQLEASVGEASGTAEAPVEPAVPAQAVAPETGVRPYTQRWRRGWIAELLLCTAGFLLYSWLRNQVTGSGRTALRNALDIIKAEKFLGLYHERTIQHAFIHADWFMAFWNIYYGTIHFIMPVVALVWLYFKAPARYVRWRNTLGVMFGLAVMTFWLYPLMPPRLMPSSYGLVDTATAFFNLGPRVHVAFAPYPEPTAAAIAKYGNLFAAMPSFHVGWSTWSVLAIWPLVRRRWVKALLVAYPAVVIFCITVTANHWLIDAVGGWLVLAAGYGIAVLIDRVRGRLRTRLTVVATRASP